MKKTVVFSLALITLAFVSCNSGNATAKINKDNLEKAKERDQIISKGAPIAKFDKTDYDFGTITEGDVIHTSFIITNVGKTDLIISDAKTTCGCTVPSWPKNKPIKPGDSETIKVSFNSLGKQGRQGKTITLFTNTKGGRELLNLKGNVNKKAK